ncbi:uncharacterized protein LOC112562807 isoform X1 [Pomacea canaliculata]|uniref:uncharacterized protein LOC112562807 isoform X1 n=1 Tax=Pomacea canaliculata TaxID=400727 RepID=UPI000D7275BF|nr:uncharacterized protein LOC112562807 isoform X1 [Pomacea canaliculata]
MHDWQGWHYHTAQTFADPFSTEVKHFPPHEMLPTVQQPTTKLSLVPFVTSLHDGTRVIIDTMTDAQLTQTYGLIHDAAQHGQGFGVDEYSDESEFRADVASGFHFAIMDKDGGDLLAAFILALSRYSRGCRVADPFIIVRPDQRGRRLGELCLCMCEVFARHLGFMGMYVDTFANNTPMIKVIERIGGYRLVGALPAGGYMTDGSMVGSLVYYKDLRPGNE